MPQAFGSATHHIGGAVSSDSYPLTVTGSNTAVVVGIDLIDTNARTVSTVTWNGISLAKLDASNFSASRRGEFWGGVTGTPDGSAHNVVITLSGASSNGLDSTAWFNSGVPQSGFPDSHNFNAVAGASSITTSTTVVASNCWLVGFGVGAGGATSISAGTGTTQRDTFTNFEPQAAEDSNGTVGTGSRSLQINFVGGSDNGVLFVASIASISGTTFPRAVSVSVSNSVSRLAAAVRLFKALRPASASTSRAAARTIALVRLTKFKRALSASVSNGLNNDIVDQQQSTNNASFGFGQFASVRYRGQGFTPTYNYLTSIAFYRDAPTADLKIYIDSGDANNIPTHSVGSELYSFIVPHAQITGALQKFTLPVPLAVTPGNKYCFYIAPFSGGVYSDDYQNQHGTSSQTYATGKEITNNNGTWSNEGLSFQFTTYGQNFVARLATVAKQRIIKTIASITTSNAAARLASIVRKATFKRPTSVTTSRAAGRSATVARGFVLVRHIAATVSNAAGRLATVAKSLAHILVRTASVMVSNAASRFTTVARGFTFIRKTSVSVSNAVARLATAVKSKIFGRVASVSVSNAAARLASVSRVMWYIRSMAATVSNAASRFTRIKALLNGLSDWYIDKFINSSPVSYSDKLSSPGTGYADKYNHNLTLWDDLVQVYDDLPFTWDALGIETIYLDKFKSS